MTKETDGNSLKLCTLPSIYPLLYQDYMSLHSTFICIWSCCRSDFFAKRCGPSHFGCQHVWFALFLFLQAILLDARCILFTLFTGHLQNRAESKKLHSWNREPDCFVSWTSARKHWVLGMLRRVQQREKHVKAISLKLLRSIQQGRRFLGAVAGSSPTSVVGKKKLRQPLL